MTKVINKVMLAVFCLTIMAVTASVAIASEWVPLYQDDFSSDPGWITNDPANLYWDAATETYHGWMANTNTSFAYTALSTALTPDTSFRLCFDSRINSVQWSAGLTFGIFDPQLSFIYGAVAETAVVDAGYVTSLNAGNPCNLDANDWEVSNWLTGVWYTNIVTYDSATGWITYSQEERDTGIVLSQLGMAVADFPSDMLYLGVSRLHMEGYTSNAVDFNIDNVNIDHQPVPAPGALVSLLSGIVCMGGHMIRRRR